ncbi:NAD-dependent epimerase/dehydratase family protein [Oricola indica]|uniref:NAD-dependent epimerase/dehydratase family protein n=1 Tax=Oricola indica TaxID=2872591 RepID=UPI001CBCB44E|nr:NAD(P)-dependent oxidoreductase [Oricola indica]
MKVFVTGASGLIGRWTCDLLRQRGHDVLGTDIRPKPDGARDWAFEECDLLDSAKLAALMMSYEPVNVIHLAAKTDLDGRSLADYSVNITGVSNLLRAVEATPSITRAVYTSSQLVCKVGYVPSRNDEYLPSTVYGESKVETEKLVRVKNGGGVSWCLVRPTTVWGPHMSDHYRSLLYHIEKGTYFHSGSGALCKSYSYVGNIAYQYMRLLEADCEAVDGRVFYLADYVPLSLRDYVNALARELGVRQPVTLPLPLARLLALIGDGLGAAKLPSPYNSFRLNNIRTEYIFDVGPTEAVCGALPFTFEDGVKATVAWHRAAPRVIAGR